MRVLLIGASGFIGSAALAKLAAEGHDIVAVARRRGAALPRVRWVRLNIAGASSPGDWAAHVAGAEAVVNCAGVLQDAPGDTTRGVHVDGIAALFAACENAGVRRVVHVSAIGADRESLTSFSATKRAGEQALMARDLDWVILRPSVVVGRSAYGGSALLRGLAALPVLAVLPDTGRLQIAQLDDVVDTIAFFVQPEAPARLALDVAGPDRLSLEETVLAYRRWLRLPEPRRVRVPRWLAGVVCRLGDLVSLLGWRAPLRSTVWQELGRGAVGDPRAWMKATGITPKSLADALAAEPASVQERWFARLYILKPVILVVLSVFWIFTGIVSVGPGWGAGINYMERAGLGAVAPAAVVAGTTADILIGLGIAVRRAAKPALYAALALSLLYIVAGTVLLPSLWSEPLGPMLKIWPILALNLVALAIVEDR